MARSLAANHYGHLGERRWGIRAELGIQNVDLNGKTQSRIGGSTTAQQAEAMKMFRLRAKSQTEIAELLNEHDFPNEERIMGKETSEIFSRR